MENQTEIWKDIVGYEGKYQVSNYSRVKSLGRYIKGRVGNYVFRNEKILIPDKSSGYFRVRFDRWFSVHRLVAIAFIDNPHNKTCVNHKDENKLNNTLSNLEWLTHRENIIYSVTKNSKTKISGVNWIERMGGYQCSIVFNNKKHYLGFTKDLELAKKKVQTFYINNNI